MLFIIITFILITSISYLDVYIIPVFLKLSLFHLNFIVVFYLFSLGPILFLVACEFSTPSFVVLQFSVAFTFPISRPYLGDYIMSVI
jgi:hypothetical protein